MPEEITIAVRVFVTPFIFMFSAITYFFVFNE
jgi:hypothetical protein